MHIQFIVISIRFLPSQSPKKRLTLTVLGRPASRSPARARAATQHTSDMGVPPAGWWKKHGKSQSKSSMILIYIGVAHHDLLESSIFEKWRTWPKNWSRSPKRRSSQRFNELLDVHCWMFTAGCSPKIKWHLPSHSMPFNWCGAFVSSDAESKSSLTERCSGWWGTVMRPETGCKVCSFFKIYNF